MGFFSRSKAAPARRPNPPNRPARPAKPLRDIEPLYPTFYQEALVDAGKPLTDAMKERGLRSS